MIDQLDSLKVDVVGSFLPERLKLTPIARHLDGASSSLVPIHSTIVVGADDIGVRHLAQGLAPSCLTIGATSHFLTLVTEHPAGQPCAGCAHANLGEPVAVIPTWSIVSFWAGLLVAIRVVARAIGTSYAPSRQVTTFWPLRPDALFEHDLALNPTCPISGRHTGSTRSTTRLPGVNSVA